MFGGSGQHAVVAGSCVSLVRAQTNRAGIYLLVNFAMAQELRCSRLCLTSSYCMAVGRPNVFLKRYSTGYDECCRAFVRLCSVPDTIFVSLYCLVCTSVLVTLCDLEKTP